MRQWIHLSRVGLLFACFYLTALSAASVGGGIETISPGKHNTVADDLKYIKRYSSLSPQSNFSHTLVAGTLRSYDDQLSEINGRSEVKVHVLLINGLTYPHYNVLPEEANSVSEVFAWSDGQKKMDQYAASDIGPEAKEIIDRIAAQDSKYSNEQAVYCALIAFDVKHGANAGKQIVLFHSTYYRFKDGAAYCDGLNALISSSGWTGDHESNLAQLISLIRQRSQQYIGEQPDVEGFASLRAKLMAADKRLAINRAIDTLSKNILLLFDTALRAHVVSTLFSPSDAPVAGNSGVNLPFVDPSVPRNALSVLENIPDNRIREWFSYINKTKVRSKTILQHIVGSLWDGFLSDDNYTRFISIINRQLRLDPGFYDRSQAILANDDALRQTLVWDKSYFLKVFADAPIGTNTYDVALGSDGKLKLTRSTVVDWECSRLVTSVGGQPVNLGEACSPVWKTEAPQLLDPFDAVAFINRSDLSLFTNNTSITGKIEVVPAIHLLYARHKEWNKNVGAGISLTVDLVTLAVPVSKLKYGPALARRIIYGVEVADKIATIAKMPVNLGFPGKRYEEIVTAYANIQQVVSLTTMGYKASLSDTRQMADYVRVVNEYEEELLDLAKQNGNIRYALDLKDKIDHEARVLKGPNWLLEHTTSLANVGSLAGKVIRGGSNLLEIDAPVGVFRQLKGPSGNVYRAADFWKKAGNDFVHFISDDAKYYIKHDPATGRMLFLQIDCEPKRFIGYALDQDKLISGNYSTLLENLKTVHGLPGGARALDLTVGGVQLSRHKANVLLGKYQPNHVPGISSEIGTDDVLNEMTILKNYSFGDNGFSLQSGSVHVLNIPDGNVKSWATFFEDYNKTFLDLAIKNKDEVEVIFVSDPRKIDLLDTYDRATGIFTGKPSGFGKEVRYLRDRGVTVVKLKDGTSVDLSTIDLSGLDWTDWNY